MTEVAQGKGLFQDTHMGAVVGEKHGGRDHQQVALIDRVVGGQRSVHRFERGAGRHLEDVGVAFEAVDLRLRKQGESPTNRGHIW